MLRGRRGDVDKVQIASLGIEKFEKIAVGSNSGEAIGRYDATLVANICQGDDLDVRFPPLGTRPLSTLAVSGNMALLHNEPIANDGTTKRFLHLPLLPVLSRCARLYVPAGLLDQDRATRKVLLIPASPNTPTSRQGTQVGPIRRFPCAGSVHSGCTLPASEDDFLNLLCARYAAFIQASI